MTTDAAARPDLLQQQFLTACRLHQQGRLAEAETAYRDLLATSPGHAEALRLLGVLRYQAGDLEDAIDKFRRAVQAGSTDGRALEALGCVLGEAGRREESIRCLQRVVADHPRQPTAFFNLGMMLMKDPDEIDGAVRAFEQSIRLDPDNRRARGALARALLCQRRPADALDQTDQILDQDPGNVHALAHKAAGLSLLGDEAAVGALVDLEHMVHTDRFQGGDGFADERALNARLAAHILGHPTLGSERTTSNGMDTQEILHSDAPEIRALIGFIDTALERMLQAIELEPGHPFLAGRPRQWYLSGWGVRMWRGGYQIPHYHKDAWISGVYYVQLPPAIQTGAGAQQGWIEFGRGPDDIYHDANPLTRRIQPVEGMLIAFPSYFWHRTLPFDDDVERLCISFNAVPADG
jgi:tetratricopeptide (TPR) repeat protein